MFNTKKGNISYHKDIHFKEGYEKKLGILYET